MWKRASSSRKRSSRKRPTTKSRTASSPKGPRPNNPTPPSPACGGGLERRRETTLFQQCSDDGLATTKRAVEFHWVARVTGTVDVFEARRELRSEDVAGFGECCKAVGVEHLGPEIRIITGCITAACKQVLEMRQAMA